MSNTVVEAMAIMSGTYLAGSMIAISAISVPVAFDTAPQAGQLLHQWTRIYDYGVSFAPPFAVTTLLLHGATAYRQYKAGRPWLSYAAAGLLTVSIVPFTILLMKPINDDLFRLHSLVKSGGATVAMDQAKTLVTKWRNLHTFRSMLPLVGAVVGAVAAFGGR